MTEQYLNMQDMFLNNCRKEKQAVTVYLINGVKLQGTITGFDSFSMVLKRNGQAQLVYKHSVATVVPSGSFADDADEDGYAASNSSKEHEQEFA